MTKPFVLLSSRRALSLNKGEARLYVYAKENEGYTLHRLTLRQIKQAECSAFLRLLFNNFVHIDIEQVTEG